MKIIIFTHTNGMYTFISLCGYSLKMNMVLKIHDYEKCHFSLSQKTQLSYLWGTH